MNRKLIIKIIGTILCIEALCLLFPMVASLIFRSGDLYAFVFSAAACFIVGFPLMTYFKVDKQRLQTRDGFVCVALCWIMLCLFGALPYILTGVPYVDAIFETVSGLTTTGASIFESPASLSRGIQFWRAMTQWMGGMGILVMVLAIFPSIGQGSMNLMKAESPGPISTKLRPKTRETAKILYFIYIALTTAETLLLRIAGLTWFDSITTSLTTISTGGFSVRDESIAYYQSEAVVWIVIVFMFIAAINFSLLFFAVRGQMKDALRSEELRIYSLIVLFASSLIAVDLIVKTGAGLYSAVTDAVFHVVTLVSTTGFGKSDFDLWPNFSKLLLLLVMFTGGCAGSTSGGIKISRIAVLFKSLQRELMRILHSRSVRPITLDGTRIEEETVSSVSAFFFAYIAILLLCTTVVSLDNATFETAFSASLSALSNVGPGLSQVGPTQNYAFLSGLSKLALSITMLFGRLEIMPLLVLLFPSVWRKK